ncbi:MAG: carboxymuconolactone decarboxylase family protein [candidate division Zixibacteria bacterium]|nr:carboxymuconolactone decarboxylase family protein [candidate division Zixibacteria bacterium]
MAFIDYIPEDRASEELKKLYDRYRAAWGGVDNIIRIHGPNPPSMEKHNELYRHLMRGPSPLSFVQREMIAVVVSVANRCHY